MDARIFDGCTFSCTFSLLSFVQINGPAYTTSVASYSWLVVQEKVTVRRSIFMAYNFHNSNIHDFFRRAHALPNKLTDVHYLCDINFHNSISN